MSQAQENLGGSQIHLTESNESAETELRQREPWRFDHPKAYDGEIVFEYSSTGDTSGIKVRSARSGEVITDTKDYHYGKVPIFVDKDDYLEYLANSAKDSEQIH